jgi:hypothetical protein
MAVFNGFCPFINIIVLKWRGSRHFSTVLKTLFYKNYFFIFFTPSIRFPPCKEVHPHKVFFGKTVWRRRKEPYVFLKPTPGKTGLHPVLFMHRRFGSSHHIAPLTPALLLEGNCC